MEKAISGTADHFMQHCTEQAGGGSGENQSISFSSRLRRTEGKQTHFISNAPAHLIVRGIFDMKK